MSYFQNILFIADNCRILQFLDAKDGSALEKHVIAEFSVIWRTHAYRTTLERE